MKDDKIDTLIRLNTFKYRKGMEKPDTRHINRIGAERFAEVVEAQRNCSFAERIARKLKALRLVKGRAS